MNTILIRLDNNAVHLGDALAIGYDQTNLPKQYFQVVTERLVYIEAEQVQYDKEAKSLRVKVINYAPKDWRRFNNQDPKLPISRIEFEKMDWLGFNNLIYSYILNAALKSCFFNAGASLFAAALNESTPVPNSKVNWEFEQLRNQAPNLFFQQVRSPIVEEYPVIIKVKFEDATFNEGAISFSAKLKKFNTTKYFSLENPHLKGEFEYIKPWFESKIGKSFLVAVTVKLVDGRVDNISAVSEDISQINEEFIESIKVDRVLKMVRTARRKNDEKVIFTDDEVFGVLNEAEQASLLNSSANNILDILIVNELAKNKKQLEFLAKEKQSLDEKLRFTLKPLFGFLFKIKTDRKQFCVWELLDSHATYVWEKGISDNNFDNEVENELVAIHEIGREEYRRQYKKLIAPEIKFHVIEHDGADLVAEDRFSLWRSKVELVTS